MTTAPTTASEAQLRERVRALEAQCEHQQRKIEGLSRAETLRESPHHFVTLARVAPVGIFRSDAAGGCVHFNQHMCTITGLRGEEMLGDRWVASLHPEDRQSVVDEWQSCVANGSPFRREYRMQRPDGSISWVLCLAEPDLDADGAIDCYVGTVMDISPRRQAEEALQQLNDELEQRVQHRTQQLTLANRVLEEQIVERKRVFAALEESEGKWRSLVQNAPDVIATVNRAGELLFVNHTRPGVAMEDVIGRSVFDFVSAEFHESIREALAKVFEEGQTTFREMPARSVSGREEWYAAHMGPIRQRDQVTAATIICRDITDRKQSEEEAKQRQAELAHFSRLSTIGEMAAALAHELNQPLAAIANYASGCTRRLESTHAELADILGALGEVTSEAHRASEIIRRLRFFLRKCEMKHTLVDLNALCREAAELAGPEARKEDVRIRLRLAEDVPPVLADEIQIVQVILNLLLNSIEAMRGVPPRRRVLQIRTRVRPRDGRVEFGVCDRGNGLPLMDADRIFEPFFTTKPQGLGMGLSISRSIIEGHGGKLWARANQGPGATFRFALPAPTGTAG